MELKRDIIIVGSGAGGATLARELTQAGRRVTIIEKGAFYKSLGKEIPAFFFYAGHGLWCQSAEGLIIHHTQMVGGTTVVSCGNMVRSLEYKLNNLNINLENEFKELEKELNIKPISENFIGTGTSLLLKSARDLGLKMELMPKALDEKKCIHCGRCVLGCPTGAKWSALDYIKEAIDMGAELIPKVVIDKVIVENGQAVGIQGTNLYGKKIKFFANKIILAAGGIGTPIILRRSGLLEAGNNLFGDLFTVTYGISKKAIGIYRDPTMGIVDLEFKEEGFILAPFIDPPITLFMQLFPLKMNILINRKYIFGMEVKIKDDNVGNVTSDGIINKTITKQDAIKLRKGQEIAKNILINAGIMPDSLITTKIRAAHLGGTAAFAKVVNNNQETKIKNLFISDASILPESPGLPPILTIIALSKRLANYLTKK